MGNLGSVRYAVALTAACGLVGAADAASPIPASVRAIYQNGVNRLEDQFSKPAPVPPLESRVLSTLVSDGKATGHRPESDAYYTYERGALTFHYRGNYQSNVLTAKISEPLIYSNKILVDSGLVETGSFVGETGLGRKVRVTTLFSRSLYVLFGASKSPAPIEGTVSFTMPPDQAAALARSAVVQVEMKYPWALSDDSDCSLDTRPAEIGRATELTRLYCVVRADVASIRLARSDTGETIHEIYRSEPQP